MAAITCEKTDPVSLCQPQSTADGKDVKWYCYHCKRYVLPDDDHKLFEFEVL